MFGIEPIAAVRLMCSNRQTSGLGKILVKDSTDSVPAPHGDKLKLILQRNTGLLGIVQCLQVVVTKQDNRTGPIQRDSIAEKVFSISATTWPRLKPYLSTNELIISL